MPRVMEDGGVSGPVSEGGRTYLEEARGHGTAWHGVVGGHVAHHGAGCCRCALEQRSTDSFRRPTETLASLRSAV